PPSAARIASSGYAIPARVGFERVRSSRGRPAARSSSRRRASRLCGVSQASRRENILPVFNKSVVRTSRKLVHSHRPMRIALALFLLPAALAGCGRAAPTGALERVRAAGVLRWGGDLAGGEPYVYEDPSRPGHLVGFEVELVEAIARELGVRAEFQQNEWSQL